MPDYAKYVISEQDFVNPYHFVTLGDTCKRDKSYAYLTARQHGLLTGWIDVEIETLTPIFIPNTSDVEPDKNKRNDVFQKRASNGDMIKSYDFFSYTDITGQNKPSAPEPVLPGSEIRGMIRSAFEAVTDSCMSAIDDNGTLYKRTTRNGKPGRLFFDKKNEKWTIRECTRLGIKVEDLKDKFHEGKKVYVASNNPNLKTIVDSFEEGCQVSVTTYGHYVKRIKNNSKDIFPEINTISLGTSGEYSSTFFKIRQ